MTGEDRPKLSLEEADALISGFWVAAHDIPITRIKALDADERLMLIVSCQMLNEMNVLERTAIYTRNSDSKLMEMKFAENAYSSICVRMFIAKLWEGHQAFKKYMQASKNFREMHSDLPQPVRDAIQSLNKRFGAKSVLEFVRNSTFHSFDREAIDAALDRTPDTESWFSYIADGHQNFLCASVEDIFVEGVSSYYGLIDGNAALTKLLVEMMQVSDELRIVFTAVYRKVLSGKMPDIPPLPWFLLNEAPRSEEVSIPFFLKPTPRFRARG